MHLSEKTQFPKVFHLVFYSVLPPRSSKGCQAEFLSQGDLPLALASCAACELVRSSCREAFAKKARAMTAPDVLDAWHLSLVIECWLMALNRG